MPEQTDHSPSDTVTLLVGHATIKELRTNGEVVYFVTFPDGSRGRIVLREAS